MRRASSVSASCEGSSASAADIACGSSRSRWRSFCPVSADESQLLASTREDAFGNSSEKLVSKVAAEAGCESTEEKEDDDEVAFENEATSVCIEELLADWRESVIIDGGGEGGCEAGDGASETSGFSAPKRGDFC